MLQYTVYIRKMMRNAKNRGSFNFTGSEKLASRVKIEMKKKNTKKAIPNSDIKDSI
jgi:hypothetical protein